MRHLLHIIMIGILLAGCQQEPYESGDTSLSYLNAEMVNVRVENAYVKSITNDEGISLPLPASLKQDSQSLPSDTTMRMMMYYVLDGAKEIKIVKSYIVGVISPVGLWSEDSYKTDPVTLTSAWMSPNGSFLNLSLGVKTGKTDDPSARQAINVALDSVVVDEQGQRTRYMTLVHDQSIVPEFFTTNVYISIPTDDCPSGETLVIDINTYGGKVRKHFRK